VNIISPTRFELTFLETSAQSFPTNYASFITCDSAEAVPASPTSPTATNNKTGINLTWTDASSDETGFKVYRKLSSETETKVIATQTAATYSDTDLTEGQTAYYQVVAYNDNGESAKSKVVSVVADFTAPTVASTNPSSNSIVDGSGTIDIGVTFSEPVKTWPIDGASGDLLSYSINGEAYTSANVAGVKILSNFVGGVFVEYRAGSTYEFKVGKDYITDSAGLGMKEDYIWSFTTP
jgi:hypothetical protein